MGAEIEGQRRSVARPSRAAVILGNDALVAARPSTPAQLASACVLAGFDIILPPSAGDEIVAAAYLDRLGECANRVVLACACPHVRSALHETTAADDLTCIAIASPPVAAARYLRVLHGDDVLITYVGDCPGAGDPAIDARFTPPGFLASLHRQGIAVDEQPDLDRHGIAWGRHLSTPGGFPARRYVAKPPVDRVVREIRRDDLTAADISTGRTPVVLELIDASCSCAAHRDESIDLEPTRSAMPLLTVPPNLDLTADNSLPRLRPSLRTKDRLTGDVLPPTTAESKGAPPTAKIPSSAATSDVPDASPHRHQAPADGAASPQPRLTPPPTPSPSTAPSVRSRLPIGVVRPKAPTQPVEVRPAPGSRLLIILPLVVVAVAAALGIAVYSAASTARSGGAATADSVQSHTDSGESVRAADSLARSNAESMSMRPAAPRVISPVDSATAADSARNDPTRGPRDSVTRRRPRRARPAEVIPGWMPQGQPTWTPDSQPRRPDTLTVPPPRGG